MEKGFRNTNQHKINDEEDLEIKNVAYSKYDSKRFITIILILLFILMLITSIFNVYIYNRKRNVLNDNSETLKFTNDKNEIFIANNGVIENIINNYSFEKGKNLILEKINTIELLNNNENDKEEIKFNVRLNIKENDFSKNKIATNKSELVIRVSYSYDNENWTYINNVLSTDSTTITPLMGNYYDIAGINSNINIATNYKLLANSNEKIKMYWKLEIIVKNIERDNKENKLKANFYLEYNDNN